MRLNLKGFALFPDPCEGDLIISEEEVLRVRLRHGWLHQYTYLRSECCNASLVEFADYMSFGFNLCCLGCCKSLTYETMQEREAND
jgi:hypothetical protein